MLPQVVTHANILDSLAQSVRDRVFHPSGWSVPSDTDTGVSFGEGLEVGVGYMRMDIRDDRTAAKTAYTMRGAYVEVGLGQGETIKAYVLKKPVGAAIAKLAAAAAATDFVKTAAKYIKFINRYLRKPSTDFFNSPGGLPGGSLMPFIMGPFAGRGSLELSDFRWSTWCFIYVEGDIGLGANIGLMFLLDPKAIPLAIAEGPLMMDVLIALCLAWAPYGGLGFSLSADVKIAMRFIEEPYIGPYSGSWL